MSRLATVSTPMGAKTDTGNGMKAVITRVGMDTYTVMQDLACAKGFFSPTGRPVMTMALRYVLAHGLEALAARGEVPASAAAALQDGSGAAV